jgi:hypothetical protein
MPPPACRRGRQEARAIDVKSRRKPAGPLGALHVSLLLDYIQRAVGSDDPNYLTFDVS